MANKHGDGPDAITEEEMKGTAIPGNPSVQQTTQSNACSSYENVQKAFIDS